MFPGRYFPSRFFAPRYFPKVGATVLTHPRVRRLKTWTMNGPAVVTWQAAALGLLLVVLFSTPVSAATITVCASGCTYTNSGVNLQAALDAAVPGDTVLLEKNVTYSAELILPNQKSCPAQDATCYITVRTGVTSTGALTPSSDYPATNVRIGPSSSANLAKIQQLNNNAPAVRTTYPGEIRTNCASQPCVSGWWQLTQLEVLPNAYAGGTLVYLGSNDLAGGLPNANAQDTLAKVPGHFLLDQLYVHGDPLKGIHHGIYLNSDQTTIQNSYVSDCKLVGTDAQAINYLNGPGHLTITNTYIEGSTENFIAGGDDIRLVQTRTATASTTTTITLNTAPVDLATGQFIACQVGGSAQANIRGSTVSTIAGSVVTVSPAFAIACDVPGGVEWNVVPKNLTFTKNWVAKNANWRNPIVPTPASLLVTTSATGGTFGAGTYYYRVVAKMTTGEGGLARSTPSIEQSVTTTGTTSTTIITWNPVTGADYYHVFGRNAGGEAFRQYLAAGSCGATCTVTDTNAATSGACGSETADACTQNVPTGTGTVWQEKNLFELKNWDTATVQGNVFDYAWAQAQTGYAILFTVVNQGGTNYGNVDANITFRDNKVRHANGGLQISGEDATGHFTQKTHDISVLNNSWEDLGDPWNSGGATERTVLFANGPYPAQDGPDTVTIAHQTFFQTGGSLTFVVADTYCGGCGLKNLTIKDSMFRRLFYGSFGLTFGEGTPTWNADTTGTSAWTNNVNVGANCALYPSAATNYCPTEAAWENEFVNFGAGNFRLKSTSLYHNAGSDGTDIGANYDTIEGFTNIALSGNNTGQQLPQPTIGTTSPLPNGQVNTLYLVPITITGGTPPYIVSVSAGLPTGFALGTTAGACAPVLSPCVVGSTPSAGTYSFTITAADSLAQAASKLFTLTIVLPDFPELLPGIVSYQESVLFRRTPCPDGTADANLAARKLRIGFLCFDLGSNTLKYAATTSPTVTWTPVAAGGGSGSVTSVGLGLPSELTVTNSPVTVTGTLTGAWATQTTNKVFAAPNGSTGVPTFRALVAADLPSTGTAFVNGGNSFGATAYAGTNDSNHFNLTTNAHNHVTIWGTGAGEGDTYINPLGTNNVVIEAEVDHTADSYSLGFSTANGRKIHFLSLQGTLQQACALGDATASTDYIFGCASSSDSGSTWSRWFGVRQDGFFTAKYLTLTTIASYTCDAAHRGQFNYIAGGASVKDIVQICAKDGSDVYAWRTIY